MRRFVAMVALILLAGCGIPVQDEPRAVPTGDPSPSASASTLSATQQTTIYLVYKDYLRQAVRDTVPNPTPQQVLDALQAKLTEQESQSGLTTGVTDTRVVEGPTSANGGVVTVQIPDMFLTPKDSLPLGQIVLSLVRVPNVEGVQFQRDGKDIPVPDAGDKQVLGVVKGSNYSSLLEERG